MKSIKELTLTKKSKFYVKVCKFYGMILKAKKEFQEIANIFDKNGYEVHERQICEDILIQMALFNEIQYLKFLHVLNEIRTEKIEENNEKIQKVKEYIEKKTSNDNIF